MSRTYSDRVLRFRRAVYGKRPGLTTGCRLLLLRLSDDMSANANVSIPRSQLAEELGTAPARITEWITQAKGLGFLDTVRRGRPGVTAVYQGMLPTPLGTRGSTTEVREGVPPHLVRNLVPSGVRDGVPPEPPTWYATGGSQEVVPNETQSASPNQPPNNAATETRPDHAAWEPDGPPAKRMHEPETALDPWVR